LASKITTKSRGDDAEERALAYLLAQGLTLVERNYRVARGPSARGAEVDLIMRDRDAEGTLVFVEVRQRTGEAHGGAAASVGRGKQQRCIRGAQTYLMGLKVWPPCRFDVVAIDGDRLEWLVAAFDASR
jgi:putative endonuclease